MVYEHSQMISALERKFGFRMDLETIREFNTLGELYDYVQKETKSGFNRGCKSMKRFFRLRKAIVEETGIHRNRISPKTPIMEIFFDGENSRHWKAVSEKLGIEFPSKNRILERESTNGTYRYILLILLICTIILFMTMSFYGFISLVLFLIALSMHPDFISVMVDYDNRFANDINNLGDLTKATLWLKGEQNVTAVKKAVHWEVFLDTVHESTGFPRNYLKSNTGLQEFSSSDIFEDQKNLAIDEFDYDCLHKAIEDEFGITLKYEDTFFMDKLEDLYRLIYFRKTGRELKDEKGKCSSMSVFYRLRKTFAKVLGTPRDRVAPGTDMDLIIPVEERKLFWEKIAFELGCVLPELKSHDDRERKSFFIGFACFVTTIVGFFGFSGSPGLKAFLVFFGIGVWILNLHIFSRLLPPEKFTFGPRCNTPGKLVKYLIRKYPSSYITDQIFLSEERLIWEKLKDILTDKMGISPEFIQMDSEIWDNGLFS